MKSELLLQQNVDLHSLNTFGIHSHAHTYARIESVSQLLALHQLLNNDVALRKLPRLILGGGSNLVLSDSLPHLVLHMEIGGRELQAETEDHFIVRAGSGESWHGFVLWTLAQNYPGLENLSLIPGTVGAAPIQNIGAYGMEMQEYFHSLRAFDLESGVIRIFDKQACEFAYRDSVFKRTEPGRFVILDVNFALPKKWQARLTYGDIASQLRESNIAVPTAMDISQAVIAIRQSKLPDPAEIGNVGSFFKNPIVSREQRDRLMALYPACVSYLQSNGDYKLAAGWLIEQCGWKGRRYETVGVYERQALVLVNLGGATGADVRVLAEEIQVDVLNRFGVKLEVEPVFV
ncbi:UDP-N-acetylmuramate dehydrogenase [Undibacterium fentianense]|uniref:UDP-N-acetylenolpyruvoylglucosamine reductase n=1 Tax=Undibacterium fentianense TaxID=2828728 RepID=A0A941E169_9BURK|nr:UDP-N-acetylmuramate dehydrogenase [Undibacterium fentianense]MBR7798764.1 UDP-N-acetylmuramate dehydrogenase [Undibacterium fentianense]